MFKSAYDRCIDTILVCNPAIMIVSSPLSLKYSVSPVSLKAVYILINYFSPQSGLNSSYMSKPCAPFVNAFSAPSS